MLLEDRFLQDLPTTREELWPFVASFSAAAKGLAPLAQAHGDPEQVVLVSGVQRVDSPLPLPKSAHPAPLRPSFTLSAWVDEPHAPVLHKAVGSRVCWNWTVSAFAYLAFLAKNHCFCIQII